MTINGIKSYFDDFSARDWLGSIVPLVGAGVAVGEVAVYFIEKGIYGTNEDKVNECAEHVFGNKTRSTKDIIIKQTLKAIWFPVLFGIAIEMCAGAAYVWSQIFSTQDEQLKKNLGPERIKYLVKFEGVDKALETMPSRGYVMWRLEEENPPKMAVRFKDNATFFTPITDKLNPLLDYFNFAKAIKKLPLLNQFYQVVGRKEEIIRKKELETRNAIDNPYTFWQDEKDPSIFHYMQKIADDKFFTTPIQLDDQFIEHLRKAKTQGLKEYRQHHCPDKVGEIKDSREEAEKAFTNILGEESVVYLEFDDKTGLFNIKQLTKTSDGSKIEKTLPGDF